jgi:hypothetical protein
MIPSENGLKEPLIGWIAYIHSIRMHIIHTKGKKTSQPPGTAADSNAEYVYIIEDQEVWFIDYIIGIAFKTPVGFRTLNRHDMGLMESGRSYTELYDIKGFQDYMEEKVGQEIEIESSIDQVTKLEKDDKRIVFQPHKKCV